MALPRLKINLSVLDNPNLLIDPKLISSVDFVDVLVPEWDDRANVIQSE